MVQVLLYIQLREKKKEERQSGGKEGRKRKRGKYSEWKKTVLKSGKLQDIRLLCKVKSRAGGHLSSSLISMKPQRVFPLPQDRMLVYRAGQPSNLFRPFTRFPSIFCMIERGTVGNVCE